MNRRFEDSNWVSIADLMTGLMIIFMFVAISYILNTKLIEQQIFNALEKQFKEEIENNEINLSPDGSISFNPERGDEMLFNIDDTTMTDTFKSAIDKFIPQYLSVITDPNFINNIKAIRIEGHTDTTYTYEYNLDLSSKRAQNVLYYIRDHPAYKKLDPHTKERLNFLFTAVGYSYSRALNNDRQIAYTDTSTSEVNNTLSRRVEFRVITSNEKLIQEINEYE